MYAKESGGVDDLQGLSRAAVRLLKATSSANTIPKKEDSAESLAVTRSAKGTGNALRQSRKQLKHLKRARQQYKARVKPSFRTPETSTMDDFVSSRTTSSSEKHSRYAGKKVKHELLRRMPRLESATEEEILYDLKQLTCATPDFEIASALIEISRASQGDVLRQRESMSSVQALEPEDRPSSIGTPKVWSETRQELCEGVPYFRAYQGGVYTHNNIAMGYLLDAYTSSRDFIGERVVVSHGGGKSSISSGTTGHRELHGDQALSDRSVAALINTHNTGQPLVLIIGNRCSIAPAKIPHRYCVMDWFRITHVWKEREDDMNDNIRYKFRFEKLTAEPGWWSSSDTHCKLERKLDLSSSFTTNDVREQACAKCAHISPVVYQQHICFNSLCNEFWNLNQYTSDLLALNSGFVTSFSCSGMKAPFDIKPESRLQTRAFHSGNDVSRIFWRGICCPQCGKLNCRIAWKGWRCSACDYSKQEVRRVYEIAECLDPFRPIYSGPPLCFDWKNPLCNIGTDMTENANTRITRYFLGADVGTVLHIACSNEDNLAADAMFKDYQTQEIDFRRRMLKTKVDGQFLAAQFSHNAGERYKYHADAGTQAFSKCAPVVSQAKALIEKCVAKVLTFQSFNEILSVAYFEGQHMSYHDDGEAGVAPVVASLSLGSSAVMKFRPKRGHESLYFHDGVNLGKKVPRDPDDSTTFGLRQSYGRDILRLHLEHGDIMIMQGDQFQKVIEHSVSPNGFRIAATARFITPKDDAE